MNIELILNTAFKKNIADIMEKKLYQNEMDELAKKKSINILCESIFHRVNNIPEMHPLP